MCFASEWASAFSLLFLFKFFFLSVSLLLLLFICGENRFSCDDLGGFFFFFFGGEKSLKAFENQLWLRWMRYGRCLCFVEKTREGFWSLCLTCGRKSAWLEKEIGEHEYLFSFLPQSRSFCLFWASLKVICNNLSDERLRGTERCLLHDTKCYFVTRAQFFFFFFFSFIENTSQNPLLVWLLYPIRLSRV